MKKENWNDVESQLDGIKSELYTAKETLAALDKIRLGNLVRDALHSLYNCISNIESFADAIYCTCEDDYCGSKQDEIRDYPDELLKVLPTKNITLGQVLDLVDTIKDWRQKNGCGIYD
jgi:hypothetical protein